MGRYHGGEKDSIYIELRVDKILSGVPRWWLWVKFLREVRFANVLFHEIGHHIHHCVRPEYADKEDTADKWGRRLSGNYSRKTYWYALPVLIPASKALRLASRKGWM
ncbi:MAG TPA: hypothetical protein VF753_06820 [Terriglobales bacterium]